MNAEKLIPTMTDEDVQKVQNFLNDHQQESEELNQILDEVNKASSEVVEEGESRVVNVSIDPESGKEIITSAEAAEEKTPDLDSLFNSDDFKFEIDDSPITLEEIKKFLEDSKDDPILNGELKFSDMSAEDISSLIDLVTRYQNKEEIASPFNKLPKACQDIITKASGGTLENNFSNPAKSLKNTLAETLLDEISSAISLERANASINSGIEKIFAQANNEIGDTIVGYTEERNENLKKYIEENITDEEKKANALNILDKINTAYELVEFKEYCKHCKIKKYDVEKPLDKHRDLDSFLNKYRNNTNYNIYNIYNAQMVLIRNINNDESEVFSDKQVRAFLLAFCKYCQNFNPNNANEHVFMFYTLYNIVLTDVNKGEKAEVSNKFLNNVKECIRNLIERNPHLA